MSEPDWFRQFSESIRISDATRQLISSRYQKITKRLNQDFYGSDSTTNHSFYVGSYGRGTSIDVSDIDLLFVLPYSIYQKYNQHEGNGQSALLQVVRESLKSTYPSTHISGDGQVVAIKWDDGVRFEIVPCFINKNKSYTYPDTHDGGSWKVTNPKPEIEAIQDLDDTTKHSLKRLCRYIRVWRNHNDLSMGGLLIDTFCYQVMNVSSYKSGSYLYHGLLVRDFFKYLMEQSDDQSYWSAPGSNQQVKSKGKFVSKAKKAHDAAQAAIAALSGEGDANLAKSKWQEIFGSNFGV